MHILIFFFFFFKNKIKFTIVRNLKWSTFGWCVQQKNAQIFNKIWNTFLNVCTWMRYSCRKHQGTTTMGRRRRNKERKMKEKHQRFLDVFFLVVNSLLIFCSWSTNGIYDVLKRVLFDIFCGVCCLSALNCCVFFCLVGIR